MTIDETAKELQVSLRTVWKYIERGWLPRPVKQSTVISHRVMIDHLPEKAVSKLKEQLHGREV